MNKARIVEAHEIPYGRVCEGIFQLECVTAAHKTIHGGTVYHVKTGEGDAVEYAHAPQFICKDESGKWSVKSRMEVKVGRTLI